MAVARPLAWPKRRFKGEILVTTRGCANPGLLDGATDVSDALFAGAIDADTSDFVDNSGLLSGGLISSAASCGVLLPAGPGARSSQAASSSLRAVPARLRSLAILYRRQANTLYLLARSLNPLYKHALPHHTCWRIVFALCVVCKRLVWPPMLCTRLDTSSGGVIAVHGGLDKRKPKS